MASLTSRRYLCLRPLPLPSLPAHPSLPLPSSTPPDPPQPPLPTFLSDLLTEATAFADAGLPALFSASAPKPSPPAAAPVTPLAATLPAAYGDVAHGRKGEEAWFARRSRHRAAAAPGSASWAEFVDALFVDHSRNEGRYTPDVLHAHEVASWGDAIAALGPDGVEGFWDVSMQVFEMLHRIPTPLNNRAFAVVVVCGRTSPDAGFTVAQLPVDLAAFPEERVLYANGRNVREALEGEQRKKVVQGWYVSVERVRRVERGGVEEREGGEEVVWEMATASDAGGKLPMWAQKMGIPGAVVKDVGLVVGWVGERRGGGEAGR